MENEIKPLDFVKPKDRNRIGMVISTHDTLCTDDHYVTNASVRWIGGNEVNLKTAWWTIDEIDIIDSLGNIIGHK
jgi:hypothetical protein